MLTLTQLYKHLFYKSFFFDKYLVSNVFQCPKFTFLKLKFISSPTELNKIKYCKLVLLFYLLTGQRPKLLVQQCKLRNTLRKKIVGLHLILHNYNHFFNLLTHRQIIYSSLLQKALPLTFKKTLTFGISQTVQDDDLLLQSLKISDTLKYQVTVASNSSMKSYFCSLLRAFKIPYKNNSK